MALSGTIKGSTNNQYIDAKITWSATQSIDGNYSMVTATLSYSRNNTGYTTSGTWSGKITINGTATNNSKYLTITYNSNTTAVSATIKVPHNADGTKTITISASGSMSGTSLSSTSISASVTLNTIPRTSSVSMGTGTMDSASTITITRASSSFTHTLTYKFGSKTVTIATKTTSTSISWTPKVSDFAAQIPSATSGTGTLTCTTYNGSTSIGSSSINVTLNLPSSVKPSLTTLTLTPSAITLIDPVTGNTTSNTANILVQKKNKLTLKASGATAGTGSTIAYYTFSGPSSYSSKITSTSTSASASINSVSSTGTLTYKVTVTDARGRTSDAITKTIECYAYSAPSIKSFDVYRANSDGIKSESGSYLKCAYTLSCSSVNNTNVSAVTGYYNGKSALGSNLSILIDLNGDTSTTYKFYLTIRDKYGGYNKTSTKVIYGDFRIFNVTQDGTGFAIGKKAESSDLFDCKHPGKFRDTLNAGGNITTDGSFGSSSEYSNSNFATYCQWADGKNHDILVRSTDGLTTGLGWVGSDTYPTVLDVRPKTVSVRGNVYLRNNNSYRSYKPDGTTDVNVIKLSDNNNVIVGSAQNNEAGLYTYGVYDTTTSSSPNMFISSGHRLYRSSSSSRRYKTDIKNVQDDKLLPEKLYELPVHEFKYEDGYLSPTDKNAGETVIGFIAEEVNEIYPIACEYLPDGSPENWNIRFMVPAMLKLIQDQKKEINRLTDTVNNLQEKLG